MANLNRHNNQLYDIWDQRWEGSDESERLTFVGRVMFKAKRRVLKNIIDNLPIRSVIEVGCGLGHTMSVYEDAGLECMGIDISPHAVNVCTKKGLNATLQKVEDVTDSYDLVSSDGMLEHFLNFEPYAGHLMRISRRYVLLIQPNHESFAGKTLSCLDTLLRPNANVYEYNYRIRDFVAVFHVNGFYLIKNHPIFFDVFRLLLFERKKA